MDAANPATTPEMRQKCGLLVEPRRPFARYVLCQMSLPQALARLLLVTPVFADPGRLGSFGDYTVHLDKVRGSAACWPATS